MDSIHDVAADVVVGVTVVADSAGMAAVDVGTVIIVGDELGSTRVDI